MKQFFNAHAHSHGSLLDGMSRPEEYAERAIELGQPAITFTDHGNLYTLMDTYKTASDLGIPFMPGCLTSGQPIITSDGIKNVEEIEVGDMVLTHKGRYRKVIRTFARPYSGDIYTFNLSDSGRCMTITSEHPVLIKDIRNKVSWVQAADIDVGQASQAEASRLTGRTTRHKMNRYFSYACFPRNSSSAYIALDTDSFMPPFLVRNKNCIISEWSINSNSNLRTQWNISSQIRLDQEFAWVIGLFAAEGSFSGDSSAPRENRGFLNGQFSICLNIKESNLANRFQKFFEERFGLSGRRYERPERNTIEVEFSCLPLAFILEGLVGRGAKNKKVPAQIKDSPASVQKSFLLGLLDGDGKQLSQKTNIAQVQTLKTASESLAWGVKEVMASLGYWVSVHRGEATGKLPHGSTHTGTYYSVHIKFNPKYTRCLSNDEYVFKPITSVSKQHVDCHVYNFEVEEDNSYVGEFVLHNCEFYRARKTRFDTDPEEMSGPATDEWAQRGPYHQTILAYNNVGYVNLLKLSSASFTDGYARKPRVDLELIEKHSKGLVVLSGCLSGALQQALLRDDYEAALEEASRMQDIVGKDNYFIEIMDHGIPEEKKTHPGLIQIAKRIGAPIVPTCDSHYTHREDHRFHDHLLCINTASLLTTPNRFKFSGDEFYLKSYEEMASLFPEEWVKNSLLIPEKLDLNIDLNAHHYPVFEIPEESPVKVIPEYFKTAIANGAEQRFGQNWRTERRDVAERLNSEVEIIQEMGYDSYFLIVQDIINWCVENNILCGPGRGSSASSLVSYCLGITHIDPLEFNLLFERFLTPGRVPDIDIDVDDRYRDQVLEYIRDKYGHDKTAQIKTVSQMRAKSCINDVARVMGFPFHFSQDIVKTMPPAQFGVPKSLDECLETEEFRKIYEEDPDAKEVIDVAKKLENLWRSDGIHAGGIIVADDVITNYCPVQQKGSGEPIVTQWDMRTAEQVGLLKIDMLGLRTLGIIQDAKDRILKNYGIDIGHPYQLVENPDVEIFKSLTKGDTAQVFQMGSDGLTNLAKAMGIDSVKDIMAALALYRPGPMGSGFHHSYAKRKRGKQRPTPLHPLLEDVLKDTYGILLYQEQIMAVAKEIAGFDPTAANKFLKSIGKKDREAMAATKEAFVSGCISHSSISESEAADLFAAIEPHADYSFAKSHAAVYAYLSYITAYLKYYYPAEFSAACLTSVMFDDEKSFRPVLNDVREKIGVEVNPPSVNSSGFDFGTIDGKVVFSISGLKGVGQTKSSKFVNFREESGKTYSTITDFFINGNTEIIDKTLVEALIYSGGLDELIPDENVDDVEVDIEKHLEILNKEVEYLGLSVTDDPFGIYYNALTFDKITSPVSDVTMTSEKKRFCGIVRNPEIKISKAGKKYAKFIVDDGTTAIQALILGKQVEFVENKLGQSLEEVLIAGVFIVFYCRLQEREEEDSVIYVTSIVESHTPRTIGDLLTSVSLKVDNEKDLVIINEILVNNSGNKKVYILLKHPDAQVYIKRRSDYTLNEIGEQKLKNFIERK